MFTIGKRFHFSASHVLTGLLEDHPCTNMHGHNYTVELMLESETLNEVGFVLDYGDLKLFTKIIDEELDHHHLNDVLPFQPSAENIARYLYNRAKELWPQAAAVRVSETPNTWAEFRP